MKTPTLSKPLLAFLKAAASESRLRILLLFMDGEERTVNDISAAVRLEQSTTSEHLALMRRNGLLVSRRSGREVYYRPDGEALAQHVDALGRLLRRCC
mgnify:CR=1 FL=1